MNTCSYRDLREKVINGGYCIGCGACVSQSNSAGSNVLNSRGMYEPDFEPSESEISNSCPFLSNRSESEIGKTLFAATKGIRESKLIGFYLSTYAGFVAEDSFREGGSSGGFGTWVLSRLLSENLVDGVIHVKPSSGNGVLFEYGISNSIEDLKKGAKSRYYPVEFSRVLREVRKSQKKYAFVGVPCFVKAVRLLCENDEEISDRIRFSVGLVCGHLKSKRFADMLAWQKGINPDELRAIDFRQKFSSGPASNYGIEIRGEKERKATVLAERAGNYYGYNWGYGFFKPRACDFCDDVVSETADVSIGDAWLPEYVDDSKGTNIIVVRNPVIQELVDSGIKSGALRLDSIPPEKIIESQEGGFRHRRDLLAYRLALTDEEGRWHPRKRVKPRIDGIDERYKKITVLRMQLAEKSHSAFEKALKANDFGVFKTEMKPLLLEYDKLYRKTLASRVLSKAKRTLKKLIKR